MVMADEQIATVEFDSKKTRFVISNPSDYIQRYHSSGMFYEIEQLLFHRNLIYRDCIVLDIGANVGNHTLFYCGHARPSRVFPFEPNPPACASLISNISQNDTGERIDLRYVSLAVGSGPAKYDIEFSRANNMGATALKLISNETATASIEGVRLDDLDFNGRVGFVKIDVEGMEMQVLNGAETLFAKQRPHIAVEVDAQNEALFWQWADRMRYHVIGVFHAYPHNRNYVAVPRS
jgi:FkbM family methyltransferase